MAMRRYREIIGLLLKAVRSPEYMLELSLSEWDLFLRLGRRARVLARLGELAQERRLIDKLPLKAAEQMLAARQLAHYRQRIALWEVNRLQRSLKDRGIPIILLKGAAYLMAQLPPARGRFLADVDILVPRRGLDKVEKILRQEGWRLMKLNTYDQHYYRQWMHELPPLRHYSRQMEVDVHHTILPLTSRLRPDPDLLLQDAEAVDGCSFKVLSPCDMALHSAAHLFYDSDLHNTLRDLIDLDDLFRHFSAHEENFWHRLIARARVLDLQRPLFYALRYAQRLLETPVPGFVWQRLNVAAPAFPILFIMDHLVVKALLPEHPDYPSRLNGLARWLLYVRSHYLRMPLHLLMPHLLRKSVRRNFSAAATH